MSETVKRWLPLAVGIVVAAVCARLGFWQLDRLEQRRARNGEIAQQLADVPVTELPAQRASDPRGRRLRRGPQGWDTRAAAGLAYRRAELDGRFDFAHEQVVVLRPRDGVPGVHVVTPLRTSDTTVILVERGWVASPDGKTVDLAALREPESTRVTGYLAEAAPSRGPPPGDWPVFVRRADPALIPDAALPPLVLRRTELPPAAPAGMRPLQPPELTNGPHLSYSIQWFAFAAIALVGSAVLVAKAERGKGEPGRGRVAD